VFPLRDAELQNHRLVSMVLRLLHKLLIALLALLLLSVAIREASADAPCVLNDLTHDLRQREEQAQALERLQKAFSLFPYNESIRKNLTAAYTAVGKRELAIRSSMQPRKIPITAAT